MIARHSDITATSQTLPTIIYILDDNELDRRHLRATTDKLNSRTIEFSTAAKFKEYYTPNVAGCLILDIRLPGTTGLDLLAELQASGIDVPVIFISGQQDPAVVAAAFRSGAIDVLSKPAARETVVSRVQQALERDRRRLQNRRHLALIEARKSKLTLREEEAFDLMILGASIKQIAGRFKITIQTASKHRARVLDKMEVDNEVQLLRLLNDAPATTPLRSTCL